MYWCPLRNLSFDTVSDQPVDIQPLVERLQKLGCQIGDAN
jgi:hypothetical protein